MNAEVSKETALAGRRTINKFVVQTNLCVTKIDHVFGLRFDQTSVIGKHKQNCGTTHNLRCKQIRYV